MMEEVDLITGATEDWETFIATLNSDRLELERFRRPKKGERPGSPEWRQMVEDHNAYRAAFYKRPPVISDWELGLVLAEAQEWDQRFNNALTPEHIRIALKALHNNDRRTAA